MDIAVASGMNQLQMLRHVSIRLLTVWTVRGCIRFCTERESSERSIQGMVTRIQLSKFAFSLITPFLY